MYSKHKDALPENTVYKIREAHTSIGLQMECSLEKHVDGIYSAYLQDPAGKWNTAGKGTTEEYCLASAYGESIEHLCNHFAFDISKVSGEAKRRYGFLRYPDEQLLPISAVETVAPAVFADMASCVGGEGTTDELVEIWQGILASDTTPFVPYYDVESGTDVLLPDAVLSKLCGSNGGGSGNTPAEAIGHALDEAIERYVKYKIHYDKLTPPTISKEILRQISPELFNLISRIEAEGELKIIVKDASLGKGFSVICVLVIDEVNQRYLSNFGAHPCFEIALERCLTELFQDRKCVSELLDRREMIPWNGAPDSVISGVKNWVSLLRDDIGLLPDSIFDRQTSWEFRPWPIIRDYNNTAGMLHQLSVLKDNGFRVFIRNNSFLGFPVFKVYIPFMSLSHQRFDSRLVSEIRLADRFDDCLLNGATHAEKETICGCAFSQDSFYLEMLLRHWGAEDLSILYAAALFDTGRMQDALHMLGDTCLREGRFMQRYLQLTLNGSPAGEREHLLRLFFGENCGVWISAMETGNAFDILREYSLAKGLVRKTSPSQSVAKAERDLLYSRLKEVFLAYPIQQGESLRAILSGGAV